LAVALDPLANPPFALHNVDRAAGHQDILIEISILMANLRHDFWQYAALQNMHFETRFVSVH
jgi:hypothetical protein